MYFENKKSIEAKIFELAIGTLKVESGACDLPTGGFEQKKKML